MPLTSGNHFPTARTQNLITTETAADLLLFDTDQNQLHTLNAVVASVWRAADGTRSISDLAIACDLDLPSTENVLSLLARANLLVNNQGLDTTFSARSSRRRLIKGSTAMGALVISVTVPLASASASGVCFRQANNCTAEQNEGLICDASCNTCLIIGGCNGPAPTNCTECPIPQ